MKFTAKSIAIGGLVAALYVVLTLPAAQFAYGPIQFRLAEVLTILPAYGFGSIPGVTIGCFLANLLNPGNLGPIDIIFGTLATLIAGFLSKLIGIFAVQLIILISFIRAPSFGMVKKKLLVMMNYITLLHLF